MEAFVSIHCRASRLLQFIHFNDCEAFYTIKKMVCAVSTNCVLLVFEHIGLGWSPRTTGAFVKAGVAFNEPRHPTHAEPSHDPGCLSAHLTGPQTGEAYSTPKWHYCSGPLPPPPSYQATGYIEAPSGAIPGHVGHRSPTSHSFHGIQPFVCCPPFMKHHPSASYFAGRLVPNRQACFLESRCHYVFWLP